MQYKTENSRSVMRGFTLTMYLFLMMFLVWSLTACSGQSITSEYELPYTSPTEDTPTSTSEPRDSDLTPFTSEEVVIGEGGSWPLGGTLTTPSGASADEAVPAVVIVHGSGPIDRDGSIMGNRIYYEIAVYLSTHGIAVLRYDKRSFVHGEALVSTFGAEMSVLEETIEDAILAADFLRADPRIDSERIFILGHSLGGALAPGIHANGGDFAGLILLAGSPRCLLDVAIEQFEAAAIYQGASAEQFFYTVLPLIEAGDADALRIINLELLQQDTSDLPDEEVIKQMSFFVDSQKNTLAMLPGMIASMVEVSALLSDMSLEDARATETGLGNAYYFLSIRRNLLENHLDYLTLPFLVMQGGRDFQILAGVDFILYKELLQNHENVTFILYDDLNHLFMYTTATNFAEHAAGIMVPGRIYPRVLRDIVDWVLAQ